LPRGASRGVVLPTRGPKKLVGATGLPPARVGAPAG
jgi:hypothetical protein